MIKVVSYLISPNEISLISDKGEVINLLVKEYNIKELILYLNTNTLPVEIDISKFILDTIDIFKEVSSIIGKLSERTVTYSNSKGSIDNIQYISNQIIQAKKDNNVAKITNFLDNLIYNKSDSYSTNDLLRFIGESNIPILNDSSLLLFKGLYKDNNKYLDNYTKKVSQDIGSLVTMPIQDIDKDINTSCSRRLHVCTEHYFTQHKYDNIFFVRVLPEDIIVIPTEYKISGKIGVRSYLITGKVTSMNKEDLKKDLSELLKKDKFNIKESIIVPGTINNISDIQRVEIDGFVKNTSKNISIVETTEDINKEIKKANKKQEDINKDIINKEIKNSNLIKDNKKSNEDI